MPILQRYYPTNWRPEEWFPAFFHNSRKLHHHLPLPLTRMMLRSEAAPNEAGERHNFFGIDRCPIPLPIANACLGRNCSQRDGLIQRLECIWIFSHVRSLQ